MYLVCSGAYPNDTARAQWLDQKHIARAQTSHRTLTGPRGLPFQLVRSCRSWRQRRTKQAKQTLV